MKIESRIHSNDVMYDVDVRFNIPVRLLKFMIVATGVYGG